MKESTYKNRLLYIWLNYLELYRIGAIATGAAGVAGGAAGGVALLVAKGLVTDAEIRS